MRIVIPGGAGHIGEFLGRDLAALGHEVVVLSRRPVAVPGIRQVRWDGRTPGPWTREIDGCDAVVNLAGRSVSCRYTAANLREMMASRIDSTRAVGAAIAQAASPPPVWLQMSTATIYAHRFDRANDEATGEIGGAEPGVPGYWAYSVEIAKRWEAAQREADTPHTRKLALRTAIVMSPGRGGAFHALRRMTQLGLGGPVAGGRQWLSWIHGRDLVRAVRFLLDRPELSGPVNLAAPHPLPQREFIRELRAAQRIPVGLPATRWMAELGAFAIRSDTELLLKSRRVVPGRLLAAGFEFDFPDWPSAAADLLRTSGQRSAG
ncbi:TIGR01777 family oxidoreductase [Crossiella sp. SN42]|uniref:TIGR01777 family oxidoreductase n=1 Tax=Crossiella sp. SN42 TaxID=2944808 RepID=UPI00207C84FA|nr:TIGR01777 family oxidoreductase [Crossiella sp. SN42]MCO1580305.1 TIGR01777 family oxidoreductase [Crossiella sp. SN42]